MFRIRFANVQMHMNMNSMVHGHGQIVSTDAYNNTNVNGKFSIVFSFNDSIYTSYLVKADTIVRFFPHT